MSDRATVAPRIRLHRDLVLRVAVDLADRIGVDALTMRRLAEQLGVVPMALYKHVANRDELLDGMVDVIVGEIELAPAGDDWKAAARAQVLSARHVFLRHPWSRRVVESRTSKTPAVLDYLESFTGLFFAGGFTVDLTHHVMHALGGRMWGFTQELFDDAPAADGQPDVATAPSAEDQAAQLAMLQAAAARYPNIVAVATATPHDPSSVVGSGCDDEFEFAFALDLLLDGIERLHSRGWSSRA